MGKKAKIIIVILSMLVVGLVSFIITDKFLLNKNQENESNKSSSKNTVSRADNDVNNNDGYRNIEKSEQKEPVNVSNEKAEAVRKALKDKEWLKNNVYVQADENYYDGDIGTQVLDFIVCKNNDNTPVIIILVSAEDIRYSKAVLVSYSDGKVTAEKINEGHIYHGEYLVDANKCVVNSHYMHGGDESMIFHSVAGGKLKFIGEYGTNEKYENNESGLEYFINKESMFVESEKVSEEEYIKYKDSLNEKQYNFVEIGTELTDNNVDKYIK